MPARHRCALRYLSILGALIVVYPAYAQDAGAPDAGADSSPSEDPEADPDADSDADSEADSEADSDADSDADPDPDPDADPEADPDADPDAAPETAAETETETDTDTDTETEAETETETETDTETDTEPDAETDTDTETETETETERPTLPPGADENTGIRGSVIDSQTSQPLAQAPVLAIGDDTHTGLTEEDGTFVLHLPPGRYTLRSYYDLYHGASFERVLVRRGRFTERRLVLDPIDEETDVAVDEVEITYRADASGEAATQALQQSASGVQDLASAEALSDSGASDASDGARQVAGVLIEDAQPIIRGLRGQFVAVLLNGTPVPSTDPDSPGVDLDLFPTSIIQNLAVLKTMTADMPAAWAGGVVDIRTVQFPTELTFDFGVSVGFNHLTTFQDQLDYDGGSRDWTTFDRSRNLPDEIPNDRLQVTRGGMFTGDDLDAIAANFDNEWEYQNDTALPNFGFGATLGNSHRLGEGQRFGYLLNVGYGNSQSRETGINRSRPTVTDSGELTAFNDLEAERGVDETSLNMLGTASIDVTPDQSLSFLAMFNRTTEDEVERLVGTNSELALGELTERWQLRYIARTLFFSQLRGDHRNFGPSDELRLRWTAFAGLGRRDEPDRRTIIYGPQGGNFRWLEKSGSGERFYSDLNQRDAGVDANLRFPLWSLPAGEASGTIGAGYRFMDRELLNRRFRMLQEQPPPPDQSLYSVPAEELFDPSNLGTLTRLREFTSETDSYTADQALYSAFANVETPLVGELDAVVGARLEIFQQNVASRDPFEQPGAEPPPGTDRTDIDVMPAASLKYGLMDGMNLRAAYAMTVIRPQVRQLAPYQYYDFQRDRNLVGNPDLDRMRVHNVDLRWEYFFSDSERFTVSGFYKQVNDFIYAQIRDPSTYATQMINADQGYVVGGEVEAAISLGRIHDALSNFSIYGNFALIHSQLQLPEELSGAVADEIRIPGQAPYVFNLSLRFDDDDTGLSAAVVYNVVGPRITDVGVLNAGNLLPNIERLPFHQLDFVASYSPSEHFKIKLKCRNLLFQTQEYAMGSFTERTVRPGATFQLGLEYSY